MSQEQHHSIAMTSTISTAMDYPPVELRDGPYRGIMVRAPYEDPISGVLYFPDRIVVKGEHGSAVYTLDPSDPDQVYGDFDSMGG